MVEEIAQLVIKIQVMFIETPRHCLSVTNRPVEQNIKEFVQFYGERLIFSLNGVMLIAWSYGRIPYTVYNNCCRSECKRQNKSSSRTSYNGIFSYIQDWESFLIQHIEGLPDKLFGLCLLNQFLTVEHQRISVRMCKHEEWPLTSWILVLRVLVPYNFSIVIQCKHNGVSIQETLKIALSKSVWNVSPVIKL